MSEKIRQNDNQCPLKLQRAWGSSHGLLEVKLNIC